KVVAVGGGVAYGSLGISHHATEDLAIMRALPEMVVVAPGDPVEASLATVALARRAGPAYLRLGKTGEVVFHRSSPEFRIGKALQLGAGFDITVIATGSMVATAVEISERLGKRGASIRLLRLHTVSPIDVEAAEAADCE